MFEMLQFCDIESLQKNAAALLAGNINTILLRRDVAVVGLCGGRSVAGVLNALRNQNIPWGRVHFFLVDERYVPIDSPDSNFKLIYDAFFSELVQAGQISKENLHPFVAGTDIKAEIEDYTSQLNEFGGRFDAVLLSIGEDGHIASLFPYHSSIRDNSGDSFIAVDNSPKPPARRISASKKLLKNSLFSLLLAVGPDKQAALESLNDEVYDEEDCPAKIVRGIPCSYLLTNI
ncbi:MAG: 6-phosphogluconolactonase [Sedimentisphaerales bacterium]|nr:6-phosphogluconolactonase [Sedimentisphaerales bacterium]